MSDSMSVLLFTQNKHKNSSDFDLEDAINVSFAVMSVIIYSSKQNSVYIYLNLCYFRHHLQMALKEKMQ